MRLTSPIATTRTTGANDPAKRCPINRPPATRRQATTEIPPISNSGDIQVRPDPLTYPDTRFSAVDRGRARTKATALPGSTGPNMPLDSSAAPAIDMTTEGQRHNFAAVRRSRIGSAASRFAFASATALIRITSSPRRVRMPIVPKRLTNSANWPSTVGPPCRATRKARNEPPTAAPMREMNVAEKRMLALSMA